MGAENRPDSSTASSPLSLFPLPIAPELPLNYPRVKARLFYGHSERFSFIINIINKNDPVFSLAMFNSMLVVHNNAASFTLITHNASGR